MPECDGWWDFQISRFFTSFFFLHHLQAKITLLYTNAKFDSTFLIYYYFSLFYHSQNHCIRRRHSRIIHKKQFRSESFQILSVSIFFFSPYQPPIPYPNSLCRLAHQIDYIQRLLKKILNSNVSLFFIVTNLQQGSQDGPPPTQFGGWSRLGFDENAQLSALRFKSSARQFFQIEHLGWVGRRKKTTKPIYASTIIWDKCWRLKMWMRSVLKTISLTHSEKHTLIKQLQIY